MKRLFSYMDIAYSMVNTGYAENLTVIATFGNLNSRGGVIPDRQEDGYAVEHEYQYTKKNL